MGGPTASVLIKHDLNAGHIQHLSLFVDSVCTRRHADGGFWIASPDDSKDERPFGLVVGALELEPDDSSLEIIESVFGWRPRLDIQIDAFCNGDEDHIILGQLVLHIAETFDGIVNFNGALLPPLSDMPTRLRGIWSREEEWAEHEPYFVAMVIDLPGIVATIPYEIFGGRRTWVYHVADSVFMRAWLAHPVFHMIK